MAPGIWREFAGYCWPARGPGTVRLSSKLNPLIRDCSLSEIIWCRSVCWPGSPKRQPQPSIDTYESSLTWKPQLKQLRLSGLAGTVSLRLQEALRASRLSHEEFLNPSPG